MVLLSQVQPGVIQTWVWNGSAWAQKHPVTSPDSLLSIAFDDAESRIVGFGTSTKVATGQALPPGDTWTWDGTNWKKESPKTSPPARLSANLVYDSRRKRVIMFGGGLRPNEWLKDAWAWNSGDWQQLGPAPDVQYLTNVAYDAQRDEIVTYIWPGGYAWEPRTMWLFDGTTWRSIQVGRESDLPTNAPLAYDGRLGKIVMFGEQFSVDALLPPGPATWTWDGKAWTKVCVGGPVGRRYYPLTTYDSKRGRLVLLGGYTLPTGNPPLSWPDDVWEFDGRHWLQRA
jgi:hypothetical protein